MIIIIELPFIFILGCIRVLLIKVSSIKFNFKANILEDIKYI